MRIDSVVQRQRRSEVPLMRAGSDAADLCQKQCQTRGSWCQVCPSVHRRMLHASCRGTNAFLNRMLYYGEDREAMSEVGCDSELHLVV